VKRLPRVQKRDAVTTGKAVRNTNVTSVICFLGVQNRTKIEPRKRLIIEIREIFVRGLRAAFPPRVCRSLNRESVPYINSFSGAAFPPSAASGPCNSSPRVFPYFTRKCMPAPAQPVFASNCATRTGRERCLGSRAVATRHVQQHACAELPHAPHTPPPPPSMAPSARRMGVARTLPLMFHMK
jgi:hypothetical protein